MNPTSLRGALARRWAVEDIKTIQPPDVEIKKQGTGGVELIAEYRAEAPFVANISLVIDFRTSAASGGGLSGD